MLDSFGLTKSSSSTTLYLDSDEAAMMPTRLCYTNTCIVYHYSDYTRRSIQTRRTTQASVVDVPATLFRLMDTDKALGDTDDTPTPIPTHMHGEREVKIEDDDHSSSGIGGTSAS